MIFINTSFHGNTTVGNSAVVCEKSPEKAAKVLEAYLRGLGLPQKIDPRSMVKFNSTPGNCFILNTEESCNG